MRKNMNKTEIQERINGLNEYMLSDSDKQLLLLKISNDYTYNKAVAIVSKNVEKKDWYSVDEKYCARTWSELDAYIDGICKGKNTDFKKKECNER